MLAASENPFDSAAYGFNTSPGSMSSFFNPTPRSGSATRTDPFASTPAAQATAAGGSSPFFSDPTTQPLMQAWAQRMGQLSAPAPAYGDIERMIRGLFNPDPQSQALIDQLQHYTGSASAGSNAEMGQLRKSVTARQAQLAQEPFSAGEEATLKTQYLGGVVAQRDQAKQQFLEQMGALGHSPTDGAVIEGLNQIDRNFQSAYGNALGGLTLKTADERQARADKSVQLSDLLGQYGEHGADRATQVSMANSGQQLQAMIQALGALGQNRNAQATLAQMLADLRRQAYGDEMTRGGQLLQTSALPSDLTTQRMASLSSLLNGESMNPQSLMQMLQSTGAQQFAQGAYNSQNNAALLSALGQIMGSALGNGGYTEYHGTTGVPSTA